VIIKKTPEQIQKMREAGRALAAVVRELEKEITPGITAQELNDLAHELMVARNAVPSFLGYQGYPASICVSPNHVIVHGIPDKRKLVEGEILSVDFGLILDGWHADTASTYGVGAIEPQTRRLLEVTEQSLRAGIEECRPGRRLQDIGAAIQEVVEAAGFSVVREYAGHQIGRQMHEGNIQVPNYGIRGRGPVLEAGMVFALEPMVNAGGWKTRLLDDGWTVVTDDGSLSAHFEHTVAITPNGPQVLTEPQG
jgi:methionyl aminopeptidase